MWRLPAMRRLVIYTLPGFVGFFITSASLPAWVVTRGTGADVAGLVTTVLLVCTVGVQMAVPKLVQRFGLAPLLAIGLIALGAPAPLLLLSDNLWWVLLISAVRGAGFGTLTVLGSTMTARIVAPARRGEAIGIYGLAIAVPNLLAVPGGVALVTADLFVWVAILGAAPLLALPIVRKLSRDAAAEPVTGTVVRGAKRAAAAAALGPSFVLLVVTLAGGGFVTFLPIIRPAGFLAAGALLLFGLTGAVSRWRAGLLADKLGSRLLLPGSVVISAAGLLGVAGGLTLDSGGAEAAVVLFSSAFLGVGYGAVQNLTLLTAFARARQRETATVSSVWNAGFDAGTAIGAGVVGVAAVSLTMPGAFTVCAALVAAALPLAVLAARPVRPGS